MKFLKRFWDGLGMYPSLNSLTMANSLVKQKHLFAVYSTNEEARIYRLKIITC